MRNRRLHKQYSVGQFAVAGSLLLLSVIYLGLAFYLDSIGAFWSPDSGARFAMIRNWIEHGSLIHWYYPISVEDPAGQIHPLNYFLFRQSREWCAMYGALFPAVCGGFYRIFGFSGLTLVPVFSGVVAAFLLYACGSRLASPVSALVPLVVGLCTPVLIFAVVFWDHVVTMALAAGACYGMVRCIQESRARFSAAAGAAIGVGVWFHELMFVLFLAALLAAIPLLFDRARRGPILGMVAGFFPPVLLWVAGNKLIYGVAGGPHLLANTGANPADHPFSLAAAFRIHDLLDRILGGLLGVTSTGSLPDGGLTHLVPGFLFFGAILVIYLAATWLFGADWQLAPPLCLVGSSVALYLVLHAHCAYGLFQATPLLIAALAIPWDIRHISDRHAADNRSNERPVADADQSSAIFYAWSSRTVWIYVLMILLSPTLPGTDWGCRYLIAVLPFLVLLALRAFEEQYRSARPSLRPVVLGCAILTAAISGICQGEGVTIIRRSMRYHADVIRHIRAVTTPIVVYSDPGIAAQLTASVIPALQLAVRSNSDLQLLFRVMEKRNLKNFTYVGDAGSRKLFEAAAVTAKSGSPSNSLEPPQLVEIAVVSIRVNHAQEDGEDLELVYFTLRSPRDNLRYSSHSYGTLSDARGAAGVSAHGQHSRVREVSVQGKAGRLPAAEDLLSRPPAG